MTPGGWNHSTKSTRPLVYHICGCLGNAKRQVIGIHVIAWWRHEMETFSALLAICAGNSPVPGEFRSQWRGTLMFSLICVWINGWVNNREAGDLRRYRAHYAVTVMTKFSEYSDIIIRTVTCGCWKMSNGKNWTKICRATSRYWSVIEHNWYVMATLDHNHYVYIDREIYTLHIHWSQLFKYTHTHINIYVCVCMCSYMFS